jgi:hypothetical protein
VRIGEESLEDFVIYSFSHARRGTLDLSAALAEKLPERLTRPLAWSFARKSDGVCPKQTAPGL